MIMTQTKIGERREWGWRGGDGRRWNCLWKLLIPRCSQNMQVEMSDFLRYSASLATQVVKNLPAVGIPGFDPWVGKIPWQRERLPSILAWRIPLTIQSMGSQRVRHHWPTFTFTELIALSWDNVSNFKLKLNSKYKYYHLCWRYTLIKKVLLFTLRL